MTVKSDLHRVLTLLSDMSQRQKWDSRVRDASETTIELGRTRTVSLVFETKAGPVTCLLAYNIRRDGDDVGVLSLNSVGESQVKLQSVYTVTQLKQGEEGGEGGEESSEGDISFAMSDSDSEYRVETRRVMCRIVNEIKADSVLSHAFSSDLTGEASTLKRSWRRLRRLAEGTDLDPLEPESDLSIAVRRKSEVGSAKLRSFHDTVVHQGSLRSISPRQMMGGRSRKRL